MYHEALFDALTRAGTLQRALDDAAAYAKLRNRADDHNLYRNVRNQIIDAIGSR
jgi:hypothetical protein